jgi:acyl-coenzyme A synthetase/AMP-(fatty) acid ligase
MTIRDFYGQTQTKLLCGNTPGQKVKAGSMGRVGPGYDVVLVDADGNEAPPACSSFKRLPATPKRRPAVVATPWLARASRASAFDRFGIGWLPCVVA